MIDIAGYDGLYAIANDGKVWSYRKNTFLKPYLTRGYLKVCLYKDKAEKQVLVHRLVAEAFLPNPQNLPQINHKDENKKNNCVNLFDSNIAKCCKGKSKTTGGYHWEYIDQIAKEMKGEQ